MNMRKILFYCRYRLYALIYSQNRAGKLSHSRYGLAVPMTLLLFMLTTIPALAQDHVLSGVVKDEKGGVLPGAGIRIQGTQKGMVTDSEGKFLLEINNPNDTLQISFVGYFTLSVTAGREKSRIFILKVNEEQ